MSRTSHASHKHVDLRETHQCQVLLQCSAYHTYMPFPNCQGLMHLVMCRKSTSNVKGPAFGQFSDASRAICSEQLIVL